MGWGERGGLQGCIDRMVRLGEPVCNLGQLEEGRALESSAFPPTTCRCFCSGIIGDFAEN